MLRLSSTKPVGCKTAPRLSWRLHHAAPRMQAIAVVLTCLLFATTVGAQTPIKSVDATDVSTLERRVESFFKNLTANSGPEQAFKDLLTGGPLQGRDQGIKDAIDQAKKLPQLYGEFVGFEKVRHGSVGEDVCVMTFLYKGKQYPVAWHFTFYRTPTPFDKGSWACIGVRFDSKVEELGK
jgi:hypothetical protein